MAHQTTSTEKEFPFRTSIKSFIQSLGNERLFYFISVIISILGAFGVGSFFLIWAKDPDLLGQYLFTGMVSGAELGIEAPIPAILDITNTFMHMLWIVLIAPILSPIVTAMGETLPEAPPTGQLIYPIIKAYESFLNGAFGLQYIENLWDVDPTNDAYFLRYFNGAISLAAPLIFSGLSFAIAARAGLFQIGAEGQMILGGLGAALAALYLPVAFGPLPIFIHIPLSLACGALVGGIWGVIPGILRAYLGAHEVVTTIMLNPVAVKLSYYLIVYHYARWAGGQPLTETDPIPRTSQLLYLDPNPIALLSEEIFLAILLCIILYWFLFRTSKGYEMRALGLSSTAAEYAGVNTKRTIVWTMFLAGAAAGIGGAGLTLGHFGY